MTSKKLGKGLGSLLSNPHATESADPGGPLWVNHADLSPSSEQPRVRVDKALESLAGSLRRHGMMQPILVTRGEDGKYEILAGERRWRAAGIANIKSVPVLIRSAPATQGERLELALIENIQREDLNDMERATACHRLMDHHGLTQAQVSEKLGLDRSTIANLVRLLELPPFLKESVSRETITGGHARALLRLNGNIEQQRVYEKIISEELSVRATEKLAKRLSKGGRLKEHRARPRNPAWVGDLQEKVTRGLGVRTELRLVRGGGGKMILHFSDLDALDRLVQGWGLEQEADELLS